jgi:protein SCO1/2
MENATLNRLVYLLPVAFALAVAGVPAQEAGHEHHHHAPADAEASAPTDPHAQHQSVADPHVNHQIGDTAGEDPHAHHKAMMSAPPDPGKTVSVTIEDLTLVDQDGRSVPFKMGVIGDRLVVMDFVYTTCTTVCPVLSALFAQLQGKLGDRLGRDVFLVSVTVDPNRDTPARLKAYAAKHGAREGWTWLTGDKSSVDRVLKGLEAYTPNFEDHPSQVLVGDGRSGVWTRFYGFPSPAQIMAKVDELAAARNQAGGPR